MSEKMKQYINDTAVKTVRTMAQAAVGVIGSTALVTEVNWYVVGSTVLLSGIMCILMSVSKLPGKEEAEE